MDFLRLGVYLAVAFAFTALILAYFRARSRPVAPRYSPARGAVGPATVYAFTTGMMPWAKESAFKHLPTYFAGIIYHFGIAAALVVLGLELERSGFPDLLGKALLVIVLLGLACGIGLLVKRVCTRYMRAISVPDDYAANLVVNALLAFAAAALVAGSTTGLFITAILLFLYIPLGKIKHCWFFFCSRMLFASYYGHRGVLASGGRKRVTHE